MKFNQTFVCGLDDIRVGQYGLHWLSNGGRDMETFIASPWYISPERLYGLSQKQKLALRSSDIWAFGIILLELLLVGLFLWKCFDLIDLISSTSYLQASSWFPEIFLTSNTSIVLFCKGFHLLSIIEVYGSTSMELYQD